MSWPRKVYQTVHKFGIKCYNLVLGDDKIPHCIACSFRLQIWSGRIVGVANVSVTCHHSRNGDTNEKFVYKNSGLILTLISLVSISVQIVYTIFLFLSTPMEEVDVVCLIPKVCFGVGVLAVVVVAQLKRNVLLNILKHYSATFKNSRSNGYSLYDTKRLRLMKMLSISLTTVAVGTQVAFVFSFFSGFIKLKGNWQYFQLFASMIRTYSTHVSANIMVHIFSFQYTTYLKYVELLKDRLPNYPETLNDVMNMLLLRRRRVVGRSINTQMTPLARSLAYLGKLYEKIQQTDEMFSDFSGSVYGFWILIYIVVTICALDLNHLMISSGDYSCHYILLEVYFCFPMLVAMLYFLDKHHNIGDTIGSVLFRYPICTLSPAETFQVQALIRRVNIQKSALSAAGMFTLGIGLLGSIAGSVVTYFFVALDYHLRWAKKRNQKECSAQF